MQIVMIGCHYQTGRNKEPNGFRLLDPLSGQVRDVDYTSLYNVIAADKADIVNVGIEMGKLKGTNGGFDRYPKFVAGKFRCNKSVTIIKALGNIGYEVSDCYGNIKKLSLDDMIKCAESFGISNGKLVSRSDGSKFISAISGTYPVVDIDKAEKSYNRDIKEPDQCENIKPKKVANNTSKNVIKMPSIRGGEVSLSNSRLKNVVESDGMTVEQKLARGLLVIKELRPFYYAVMQTLPKKESVEIPTMAVSFDSLYYNVDFVKQMKLSELIFVELHEILHIAMRHLFRRGLRDPELWNIATDMYINRVLCVEFGIEPGGQAYVADKYRVGVSVPKDLVYDDRVDIKKDTPESIYTELVKENKKSGQQGQGQQGQGQQGQQGQGQQGQGQQGQGQQGQGQQGQGQGQQGQGQQGQGQQGQGQQGQGQQGQGQGQQGQGQQGQGQQGQGQQGQGQQGQGQGYKFRGREVASSNSGISNDMVEDGSKGMSETAKNSRYDSIMKKAKVLEKQMQQGKGKGHYGVVEAYVDEELVPKVNWKTILMNRLVALKSDEKSLSTPDRRFVHERVYIEGERQEDELLRDIKVCVDTSGSMSDEDLAIAFSQIGQLLKTYKTEAELIFWDDGIQSVSKFDDQSSFRLAKYKASGRGGTDPNCVFELFNSKDYKIGKRAKPALIIMFTDGIFSGPSDKYKAKFGRDTLWVISGDNLDGPSNFKPPFGKVAKLHSRR